jgi:hypothetical protein
MPANIRPRIPRDSGAAPSTVASSAAKTSSNSAMVIAPVSSRWIGVSQLTVRESHCFNVRVNDAGSMPSAACQARIESPTGPVNTPP